MITADIVLRVTLIALAIASVLALIASALYRRHRAHLTRLAARHSMSLTRGKSPVRYVEMAGRLRGNDRKASVSDLMLGRGEEDGLFFARRKIGRVHQQLLYFELESSAHLDGFYVVPAAPQAKGEARLSLHWCASRTQWSDEKALSMAARVMYNVSSLGNGGSQPAIGVEVKGRRVWIHSLRKLRGADLDRFFEDAMRLRQLLRKSLERTNGIASKSGRVRSISAATPAVHA